MINRRQLANIRAYAFLTPFLIFFGFMVVYPIFLGVKLSFYGQRGARIWFIGLSNYINIFTDKRFWESFRLPIYLLAIQVPFMIFIAIIIAFLYERTQKYGETVYRFIYYLPYTIPGIVAGIVWSYIFSDSMSPFQPLLDLIGFSGRILTRQNVPLTLLIIILWEFTGYTALIIYSALLSIPKEYTEQAQLDGASFWQIAFRIKIPMLQSVLITLFIFNAIGALQVFNEPWMLRLLVVLPPNYTPAMYIYTSAFQQGRFTYAAAMGIILACIAFIVSLYVLRAASKQILNQSNY
ncbi:MAG: carbohydrate ABC transporter permease [Bacteroidota bacterium]